MANSNERGPVRRGWPAFGWALTGTAEYRTRSSATTSIRCGPTVQLVPIIATGSAGQHGGDLARRLAAQGVRVVGERGLRDQRQSW